MLAAALNALFEVVANGRSGEPFAQGGLLRPNISGMGKQLLVGTQKRPNVGERDIEVKPGGSHGAPPGRPWHLP
jgi:hypothetical protein